MILLQFIIMFSSGYFYLLYPYLGNAMLCCAMCIFSQFMLALKSAVLGVFYTMEHSKLQETVCFTGELVAVFLLAHHSALLPEPQFPFL